VCLCNTFIAMSDNSSITDALRIIIANALRTIIAVRCRIIMNGLLRAIRNVVSLAIANALRPAIANAQRCIIENAQLIATENMETRIIKTGMQRTTRLIPVYRHDGRPRPSAMETLMNTHMDRQRTINKRLADCTITRTDQLPEILYAHETASNALAEAYDCAYAVGRECAARRREYQPFVQDYAQIAESISNIYTQKLADIQKS